MIKLLQYCENSLKEYSTESQLWEQSVIRENKTFITKKEICSVLGISACQFNKKIYNGIFPEGKKRYGKKELFWIKEDLVKIDSRIKNCSEYIDDKIKKEVLKLLNDNN